MFKLADNVELNQISLTGLRALVFIGLLIVKPRSFDEIKQIFIDLKIMDENSSDDIIRIDLNTIKSMGCEVSRVSSKTNGKYVLTKHPFTIKVSADELKILKKIYKILKQKSDLKTLIQYDELFRKIAFYICDEESRESILGISALKYYDIGLVKDLILDCKNKRTLDLVYKRSELLNETRRQVIAQELVYKNDKLYLYAFDSINKRSTVFNVRRIKSILARLLNKNNIEPNSVKIKFSLRNIPEENLDVNENIVEYFNEGFIVEGFYHNDFLAMQRVLSFGAKCTVLAPDEFKNKVVNKIKEMRKLYEY